MVLDGLEDLVYHVSMLHRIPNEYTTYTFMQYWYEHNVWAASKRMWNAHLESKHLQSLNDLWGIVRRGGVVVVTAYCLFCLGNTAASLHTRFAQFHDVFDLHEYMKKHTQQLDELQSVCPHPLCDDHLNSVPAFWEHANSVHGVAPFGPSRIYYKRKKPGDDNSDQVAAEAGHQTPGAGTPEDGKQESDDRQQRQRTTL
jgi:hypothetical protein